MNARVAVLRSPFAALHLARAGHRSWRKSVAFARVALRCAARRGTARLRRSRKRAITMALAAENGALDASSDDTGSSLRTTRTDRVGRSVAVTGASTFLGKRLVGLLEED